MPSATDAAEPLDEPPGVRARSANALEARTRESLARRLASGRHSPRFVCCMSFCQR